MSVQEVLRSILQRNSQTGLQTALFNNMWYPGKMTEIKNNEIKVSCMKKYGKNTSTLSEDHYWYKGEEILCKICDPVPLNACFFCLSKTNFKIVCKYLEEINK